MRYFILWNPTKKFVQKLYRLTTQNLLQYHGEQGGWHYSAYVDKEVDEFINSEHTEEVTEAEMAEYLKGEQAL